MEPKRTKKEPKGTKLNQNISGPFSYTNAVKFYRSVHSETQLETEIQELIYYHRKCVVGSAGKKQQIGVVNKQHSYKKEGFWSPKDNFVAKTH